MKAFPALQFTNLKKKTSHLQNYRIVVIACAHDNGIYIIALLLHAIELVLDQTHVFRIPELVFIIRLVNLAGRG